MRAGSTPRHGVAKTPRMNSPVGGSRLTVWSGTTPSDTVTHDRHMPDMRMALRTGHHAPAIMGDPEPEMYMIADLRPPGGPTCAPKYGDPPWR